MPGAEIIFPQFFAVKDGDQIFLLLAESISKIILPATKYLASQEMGAGNLTGSKMRI
jgi:hypothetical protein